MKTTKKRTQYIDNKKFYEEIVKYHKELKEAREAGREDPKISNYIGECICKIAEKLSTKPCFINYSFRDEMIADGIENSLLYFKDYNPDYVDPVSGRGQNPFAYFTQVIYYAFLRRIYKEEKNRYTIYKNFQETITNIHDLSLLTDDSDSHIMPSQMYDNINQFMSKFEEKERVKKQKRKQTKSNLEAFFEKQS